MKFLNQVKQFVEAALDKVKQVAEHAKLMLGARAGQAVTINNIVFFVGSLVVAGLVATFASDVVADINADQTANSAADNTSQNALDGILNTTAQFPNVGTVIGAALIISILLAAFLFVGRR